MIRAKADYFDAMATAPWAVEPFRSEDRPKIARLLSAADIRPGACVLEPGCGTGRLTEILADAVGPSGRVLALDFSPKMAQACRNRLSQRRNVQVLRAAVEECPLAMGVFDVAVCHQVVPHFDRPATALAAIVQRLKRGGRLLVVHFANAAVINEIHRTAAPPIRDDRLPQLAEMQRLMTAAGLSVDWSTDDSLGYLVRGMRPGPVNA